MDRSSTRVLSRLAAEDFLGRESDLQRLINIAGGPDAASGAPDDRPLSALASRDTRTHRRPQPAVTLLLGGVGTGKSELIRQLFDRLFHEGGELIPFHFVFSGPEFEADRFASDYVSRFLAQLIAFRRRDADLISAGEQPLATLARLAKPEDYALIRDLIDSFERAEHSGDRRRLLRVALSMPASAAARLEQRVLAVLDDVHLLALDENELDAHREARVELVRILSEAGGSRGTSYLLSGLRRPLGELLPPDRDLFDSVEFVNLAPLTDEQIEKTIRAAAEPRGVEVRESTIELMIQQLGRDLFYIHALLDAAAARGIALKTFMDFERVYTGEVMGGRIDRYLTSLLREVAPEQGLRRVVIETLATLVDAGGPIPIDALNERICHGGADALLDRLHARELLDVSYGFVSVSADPVLADYVRAKYRNEISGSRRPVAGEVLLGEKLRQSYRLMMSRYNRAMQAQLVELVSRFDFQAVPASLFDQISFDERYRGMSRVQIRRALDDEQQRVRLPQIVLIDDQGSGEQSGIDCRVFRATGFEGGIYSDANEVHWWITLINSREPVDLETLRGIEQRFESNVRGERAKRDVRWNVSKEGFSAACAAKLAAGSIYFSNYSQFDLITDCLTKHTAAEAARLATEFELVIPIEDEAELIAARTVEQIARGADFSQDAVNQIKTALIEACINAAEHSDSPDRRIHQRFSVEDDRLTITVANKGKVFGAINGSSRAAGALAGKVARGRGLQIIRALMDDVYFERNDDGTTLVMTKLLKRPENQ